MAAPARDARPVREAENRLEHFNADRERLLAEVERRVVARRVAEGKQGGDASLEYVLNDVAFSEIKRLEASRQKNGALERWKDLSRRLMAMNEAEKEGELRELVRYYGRDVVGNFGVHGRGWMFWTALVVLAAIVAISLLGWIFWF